jgi:hypothetical protein
MLTRYAAAAAFVALAIVASLPQAAQAAEDDGIVKFKSSYDMPETIKRMKKDIVDKGVRFFDEIDQSKLPPTPASLCCPRRCSCSATRRSARSS